MSIEVKQLTINSTLQRNEGDDMPEANTSDEEVTAKTKKNESSSGPACLDPDQIKAEVLAACKKLIRQSMNERRAR